MPPPILDERSKQDSHRAKVRIGVAAALLVTAIVILTALNQRREENTPEAPAAQPAAQTNLSSTDMEASAIPEESPSTAITSLPDQEPVAPPPPPEPGKLPDTSPAAVPKATAAPALEEESAGAPQQPFVARAVQSLSKPQMSAAAVQSPSRSSSAASPPAPSAPLASKGYAVQLGVFTDIDNAKQLQSKLAEHGIPSHTETRVQIGPFKSREEADRAREKLKKLGIAAVIRGQ